MSGAIACVNFSTGADAAPAAAALADLQARDAVARLWAHDGTLWTADAGKARAIAERLGWLTVCDWAAPRAGELESFAAAVRAEGISAIVLLGMGGSGLAAEDIARGVPATPGAPAFHLLDSTVPAAIRVVEAVIDPARTLFILASKSGGTVEVQVLYAHFRARMNERFGAAAGGRFIAISDPGTALAARARAENFRQLFLNPPDIGGRYSALSLFGLVPGALLGSPPSLLLNAGAQAAALCREGAAEINPGVRLGAAMGGFAAAGRDKMLIRLPREWRSLGLWIEQLVAESTGKLGHGIVPVVCDDAPHSGPDRFLVDLVFAGEGPRSAIAGLPSVRLEFSDANALGAAFFIWEFATAISGVMLGVDPFDQPDVQASKDRTSALLARLDTSGHLPATAADDDTVDPRDPAGRARLRDFLQALQPGDHLALTAFTAFDDAIPAALVPLRQFAEARGAAVTFGFGPRYLHSTGQLHKGGGVHQRVLQFTTEVIDDLPIPGAPYGFASLMEAQARGDLEALRELGRPVLRVALPGDPLTALHELMAAE